MVPWLTPTQIVAKGYDHMNNPVDQGEAARAKRDLAQVRQQIERAQGVLRRLQQDVAATQDHPGSDQAALLLEANEALVASTLRARSDADSCAQELISVSRTINLDALTGLPNRVLLRDRFEHAIANGKRHGVSLALLFLDIDGFKQINDDLGHAVGDAVLKLATSSLTSCLREADTASRHGGDEFLILLDEVAHVSDAVLVADKIIEALAAPHRVGEHVLRLKASIGISVYPDDGTDADTLIGRADAAMYRAKRQGLGSVVFRSEEFSPSEHPLGSAQAPPAPESPLQRQQRVLAGYEHRNGQLREANGQLVLAALSAQDLQAAAEQAQRRQTEFLAVLAHELRNPLTPIRNAAAMLGASPKDEVLPRLKAIIERQVGHMSRLVGDLIDVSRVHTGKLRLERRDLDLAATLDAAVDACRPAMELRLQRFDVQVPACALLVHGDADRLAQVFSNLLDNASKYTPQGGVVGLLVQAGTGSIVITVSDSGIGITEEALPHVFDPFVQDTHAIGFNGAGLGIGLTVVRELVEAHGGTVVAASAGPGLGSQFVVTLPRINGSPAH